VPSEAAHECAFRRSAVGDCRRPERARPLPARPDVARLAQSLLEAAAALIATGGLGQRDDGHARAQRDAITVINDTDADAPLTVTVEEASRLLGISRAHGYELVARGELPAIRLGRRDRHPTSRSHVARARRGIVIAK